MNRDNILSFLLCIYSFSLNLHRLQSLEDHCNSHSHFKTLTSMADLNFLQFVLTSFQTKYIFCNDRCKTCLFVCLYLYLKCPRCHKNMFKKTAQGLLITMTFFLLFLRKCQCRPSSLTSCLHLPALYSCFNFMNPPDWSRSINYFLLGFLRVCVPVSFPR